MEARLQAVAATLEDWLNSFGKLAERKDMRQAELPHFPADEFLSDLQEAAFGVLRAGGDPVPVVEGLAGRCREHNAKIVAELEKYAGTRGRITVERVGLLRRAYLSELEIGIRAFLFRLKLAVALVRFRSAQNLSLRELERLSGVSASYLSQIERGISGMPSLEVLAHLDAVLVTAGKKEISLLRILDECDNGLRAVQEEAVRLSGALARLMGGVKEEPPRCPGVRQTFRREAPPAFCSSSMAWYAQPSARLRRFASRSDDQFLGICADVAPPPFRAVSDELYDAIRRLNPELQQALLRLVKEMLRVQEAGSRKPERGGEEEND